MRNRADKSGDFNPEKFLAAELKKKKPAGNFVSSTHFVTAPNGQPAIVLEGNLRRRLLSEIDAESGKLNKPENPGLVALETGVVVREVLRRALAQHGLKVGKKIFHLLVMDLLLGMAEAFLEKKRNEGKPKPPPS